MTIRTQIIDLLTEQGPMTSSALSKVLKRDRSSIKDLLFILERKGKVKCTPLKRGGVVYKFWQII